MSVTCRDAQKHLGEGVPAEIDAHVRRCPDCSALYASWNKIECTLKLPAAEMPADVSAQILQRLNGAETRGGVDRPLWDWGGRALATPSLALVMIMTFYGVVAAAIAERYPHADLWDTAFLHGRAQQDRFATLVLHEPTETPSSRMLLQRLEKRIRLRKAASSRANRESEKDGQRIRYEDIAARMSAMFQGSGQSAAVAVPSPRLGGLGVRSGAQYGGASRASLRFPTPVVRGALPKSVIARVVGSAVQALRACYEQEVAIREAPLRGQLLVKFTIAPNGKVTIARVIESTFGSNALESCVIGVIESLMFPKPMGGGVMEVSYPFVFEPEK